MSIWQCGRFALDLDVPRVMGIINLTPDSFSDGGRYPHRDSALRQAETMIEEGADLLDLGAESTRPGAVPVPLAQELDRLMPVLELVVALDVPISVDTYKPEVMRAALAAGASVVNDVCALRQPGAFDAIASSDCGVVLMHMQGQPENMQQAPHYADVVHEVAAFLTERLDASKAAGVAEKRVVIDPGFGFGKRAEDNQALLQQLARLRSPRAAGLLVGVSRKSMLGSITSRAPSQRLGASVAAALVAFHHGARIIRCHDVAATADALMIWRQFAEASTEFRNDPW